MAFEMRCVRDLASPPITETPIYCGCQHSKARRDVTNESTVETEKSV
jgi:hypothetical protein